ncbi:MAG: hypothetical protein ACRD2X_02240 [Vicinamibacteraceae bacterium]
MPPRRPTRYEAAIPQMREAIACAVDLVAQLVARYPRETLLTGADVAQVRDHIHDPYVLAAAWAAAGIAVTKDEDLAALVRKVVAELLTLARHDGTHDDPS